jgi:Na+-transporting NADH:ubiquinone oxidoreductase subunit F
VARPDGRQSEAPVTRAYSLANRPEDSGQAVFNIRLAVPPPGARTRCRPGVVSSWLFSGAARATRSPFGPLRRVPRAGHRARDGLCRRRRRHGAPARDDPPGTGARHHRRIRYFYGARSLADLFYAEEFEALAATHDTVQLDARPVRPGARATAGPARPASSTRRCAPSCAGHPAPEDCEYYLCGPPVMISAVLATLERLGRRARSSIFYDDFGA